MLGAWSVEKGKLQGAYDWAWGLGPGAWGLGPGTLRPGTWGLGPGPWGSRSWALSPGRGAWELCLGPGAWGLGLKKTENSMGSMTGPAP